MNTFINPRKAVLAFAFAGFAGLGMSSFASQASASLIDECVGNSKGKVVACCKQYIERVGRPIWMSNGQDNNCAAVATCVSKRRSGGAVISSVAYVKPQFLCYLHQPRLEIEHGRSIQNSRPSNRGNPGKD